MPGISRHWWRDTVTGVGPMRLGSPVEIAKPRRTGARLPSSALKYALFFNSLELLMRLWGGLAPYGPATEPGKTANRGLEAP
jgi:hypothetical protein